MDAAPGGCGRDSAEHQGGRGIRRDDAGDVRLRRPRRPMSIALASAAPDRAFGLSVERAPFGRLPGGRRMERFTLRNRGGMEVSFTGWGGAILSIRVPDRH